MNDLDFNINLAIRLILDQEQAFGNKITEISKGWPKEKSILILLDKPFHKKYDELNLKFTAINDPHYWKEQYEDQDSLQTIACKF